MNGRLRNVKPAGGNRWAGIERKGNPAYLASLSALYGGNKPVHVPGNWRERLPDPATYYGTRIAKLGKPNGAGCAQGVCPFHDDHNKSLSVCVAGERGSWRCDAGCGGGDLVGFHSRLHGLDFRSTVRDLIGGDR
jgi:hypothetical protein